MAKKADAWKEYEEAALVDMMLKVAVKHPHKILNITILNPIHIEPQSNTLLKQKISHP